MDLFGGKGKKGSNNEGDTLEVAPAAAPAPVAANVQIIALSDSQMEKLASYHLIDMTRHIERHSAYEQTVRKHEREIGTIKASIGAFEAKLDAEARTAGEETMITDAEQRVTDARAAANRLTVTDEEAGKLLAAEKSPEFMAVVEFAQKQVRDTYAAVVKAHNSENADAPLVADKVMLADIESQVGKIIHDALAEPDFGKLNANLNDEVKECIDTAVKNRLAASLRSTVASHDIKVEATSAVSIARAKADELAAQHLTKAQQEAASLAIARNQEVLKTVLAGVFTDPRTDENKNLQARITALLEAKKKAMLETKKAAAADAIKDAQEESDEVVERVDRAVEGRRQKIRDEIQAKKTEAAPLETKLAELKADPVLPPGEIKGVMAQWQPSLRHIFVTAKADRKKALEALLAADIDAMTKAAANANAERKADGSPDHALDEQESANAARQVWQTIGEKKNVAKLAAEFGADDVKVDEYAVTWLKRGDWKKYRGAAKPAA